MNAARKNRLYFYLDMVIISNIKKRGISIKKVIVYVNSALFLEYKFTLQVKNVKYEAHGMIKEAYAYIANEKYFEAEKIFDQILSISSKSYPTYFGKFVVCLMQDKPAYPYLKKAIEIKNDTIYDDYYRLYLDLYNTLELIDDDYEPLVELLALPRQVLAFNKKSYNGQYLELLRLIKEKDYRHAKKTLECCLLMKNDIHLIIIGVLLDKIIKYQHEKKLAYELQEQELEKMRTYTFVEAIKAGNLKQAKKALEVILNFRNYDHKDNYIYYLFLELLETIEMVENNLTYEIMPVNYNYAKENDYLYTFFEATSAGDFKTALKVGRKCRGKVLDNKQKMIKVNLYVILLEILFAKLDERAKNIDNIYRLIISNIDDKHYKHALEIYHDYSEALNGYNKSLIEYLFNILVEDGQIEIVETPSHILDKEDNFKILKTPIKKEEKKIEKKSSELKSSASLKITKPINNSVMLFLRHNEPNNELFQKYQICLVNRKYDEAKVWLDQFAEVLTNNGLKKRLDYYYYQINLGLSENGYPDSEMIKKKQLYFLAYTSILEKKYDIAEEALNKYINIEPLSDIRGYLLLGRLYSLMKNRKAAVECYIYANSIAPSPDAYYFLGELYFKMHRWADAVFCYLTYNEFYPKENTTVYLNLSECYKRLGRPDKVVKYLKIAEEINVDQKRGLYLKDRILKAEMINKQRREHFLLDKNSKSNFNNLES